MQSMGQNNEEQEVIVRGSKEHEDYLNHRFGRTLDSVNGFEARLAIAGRPLLFFYVAYITVRASISPALPKDNLALTYSLLALDAFMLLLQVMGLEGSMPGLLHLADEMEAKGKEKEARSMIRSSKIVQWLLGATAVDIVLQATHSLVVPFVGSFDISGLATFYSDTLLITRVVAVGMYLVSMARLSHNGPKIISQYEAQKQEEKEEQKQIRIDNANIMNVFSQAIAQWASTQPDVNVVFTDSIKQLESVVAQRIDSIQAAQNERISALSRSLEAAQFGSNIGSSVDTESLMLQVQTMLSRSNTELMQSLEAKIGDVSRQVSRMESATANTITNLRLESAKALSEAEARNNETLKKIVVEAKASAIQKNVVKDPVKPHQAQITDITEAREERQGGLSVEELKLLFESDEPLLKLSGSALSQKYGISKASANRAKKEYIESHPESLSNLDSGELAAVSL